MNDCFRHLLKTSISLQFVFHADFATFLRFWYTDPMLKYKNAFIRLTSAGVVFDLENFDGKLHICRMLFHWPIMPSNIRPGRLETK